MELQTKKVLITGGAGFIGSHIVDTYIAASFKVIVVDDLSTGKRENINSKASFYKLDIRDYKALRQVFLKERPEVVNHHAAQASVIRSLEDPVNDASVNILGSLNLINLSLEFGVKRFIFASTGGAIYGELQYLPCDEEHPTNPLSPYGAAKLAVEHYLYLYHKNFGFDYLSLRYPNVYGPRQDPFGEAGVVAIFSGRMLKDKDVEIFGDGNQERDFVYVSDIARANLLALNIENPACRILNLGSGVGTSVNHLLEMLKRISGYKKEPIYRPKRSGEVYKIFLSYTKAQRVLQWKPQVPLEEGLERTVKWFKEEGTERRW